jgi:glycosyltransferase involved in cell wall biosynthesis
MSPFVSVIIPFYNRFNLFRDTFNSLVNQTLNEFEVIIVDDGSIECELRKMKDLISRDYRFVFIEHGQGNRGPSFCRNYGASNSKSEYLLFLDSDDIITEYCLQSRVELLNKTIELDFIVFPQHTLYKKLGDSNIRFSKYFNENNDYVRSFLRDDPPWCVTGPIWRKSSFLNIGGFDVHFRVMEDPEFHLRAILSGLKFEVLNGEADFFYRLPIEVSSTFYSSSISGRIDFYRKVGQMLAERNLCDKYKDDIRVGIIRLFKNFLLYRIKQHNAHYDSLVNWVRQKKLLSSVDLIIIWLVAMKNQGLGLFRFVPASFLLKNLK